MKRENRIPLIAPSRLDSSWSNLAEYQENMARYSSANAHAFPTESLSNNYEFLNKRGSSTSEDSLLNEDVNGTQKLEQKKSIASINKSKLNHDRFSEEFKTVRLYTMGEFDLDQWWRRTTIKNRMLFFLLCALLALSIIHLGVAIHSVRKHFTDKLRKPYVCQTELCEKAALWLKEAMNMDVSPCDNFYEFMCGNYEEKGEEGQVFQTLVTKPRFKVELGQDSILAVILKNFKNDPRLDQSIKFYQSCLDMDKRHKYGMTAYINEMKVWFGTGKFTEFEKSTKSLEEVAVDIFRLAGHACFIKMGFYPYPFVLIAEPVVGIVNYRFQSDPKMNVYIDIIMRNLLQPLGVHNETHKDLYTEMVKGVEIFGEVMYQLFTKAQKMRVLIDSTDLNNPPQQILDIVRGGELSGYCPPMGINFNYSKVIELFLQEDFKLAFISPTAKKFVFGLQACFNEEPSRFTKYKFQNPRSAFAAFWIADISYQFVNGLDISYIMSKWGFKDAGLDGNFFFDEIDKRDNFGEEYTCMSVLFKSLNYLPSIRYLNYTKSDPDEFIRSEQAEVMDLYKEVIEYFYDIPNSEIDWRELFIGKLTFRRGLRSDVAQTLVGGVLDRSLDEIPFTDDFLGNFLIANKYSREKARNYWIGSTDTTPNIKWWASGGPNKIQTHLHNPHFARTDAARFVEQSGAATNKQFELFLGRLQTNYIIYPMPIFVEIYEQILAVKHGCLDAPLILTFLSLLNDAVSDYKYRSITKDELVGEKPTDLEASSGNRSCRLLVPQNEEFYNHESYALFNYYTVTSNISHFTWTYDNNFLAVLAAKMAYKHFRLEFERMKKIRVNFDLPEKTLSYIMDRVLPHHLFNYTEDHLFFMSFVRRVCRESWKVSHQSEREKQRHYFLETTLLSVLMQMEEFSDVWNCTKKTFMNNRGEPRCFRWVP